MGVARTPGACSAGVTETDHMDEDSVAGTCVGSLADSPWVDSIAPALCREMQTVAVLMMFWRPGTVTLEKSFAVLGASTTPHKSTELSLVTSQFILSYA